MNAFQVDEAFLTEDLEMQKSINKEDFLIFTNKANCKDLKFEDIQTDFNKTLKKHFEQISRRTTPLFLKVYFDEYKKPAKDYIKSLKNNNFIDLNVNSD